MLWLIGILYDNIIIYSDKNSPCTVLFLYNLLRAYQTNLINPSRLYTVRCVWYVNYHRGNTITLLTRISHFIKNCCSIIFFFYYILSIHQLSKKPSVHLDVKNIKFQSFWICFSSVPSSTLEMFHFSLEAHKLHKDQKRNWHCI